MVNRRKFLIGAGSFAAATAGAIGTGAFSNVLADRSVSVNVPNDAAAYVGMDASTGANSNFTEVKNNGEVDVALDGDGVSGNGINPDSTTTVSEVFRVTNQGTNPALFFVDPASVTIDGDLLIENDLSDYIDFYADNLPGGASGISLTATYVGGQASLSEAKQSPFPPEGYSTSQMENKFDGVLGSLAGILGYPDGSSMVTLQPGKSFDFGLFLREGDGEEGDGEFGDVELTIRAGAV